ncbi:MAG: hydroxymethylbilane synthase [Rickettsiaceae bacterium]|nr:hydroxymethylbilane synthase [Rickettsiaceae bacterium]
MQIKIGTRKSNLALIQTQIVIQELKKYHPAIEFVIVPVITTGDKILDKNLYDIGGKALFLKELEEKLLEGSIDIAVHSLKDVPGILSEELKIFAMLEREDYRDCFVSLKYKSIEEMPKGAIIGTSSVRRKVIIEHMRPDLQIVNFRGNVNSRLEKLKTGQVDATILACAGLVRLGLFDPTYCYPIDESLMLPAVGQGVICIEGRKNDIKIQEICQVVNHQITYYIAQAERGILTYLDASCRTPIAGLAYIEASQLYGKYMLASEDGQKLQYYNIVTDIDNFLLVGAWAGEELSKLLKM